MIWGYPYFRKPQYIYICMYICICITSSWVYKLITGRNTTLWDLSERTFLYLGFSWGKEPCFCGTIVIFVLFGRGNDDKHWHFKLMKMIGNRIEWVFMIMSIFFQIAVTVCVWGSPRKIKAIHYKWCKTTRWSSTAQSVRFDEDTWSQGQWSTILVICPYLC
jgi:hypothetical protein